MSGDYIPPSVSVPGVVEPEPAQPIAVDVLERTAERPRTSHRTCCTNNSMSLCGTPHPSTARLYAGPSASCVVCADIEHTGFCPVNGQSCRNNCWGPSE